MAVYEHLTKIRGQIESAERQLRGIDNLATLSTLNLALLPTEAARPVVAQTWRPRETARRSTRLLLAFLRRAKGVVVVSMDPADPGRATFVTKPPAPAVGNPMHYDGFIQMICNRYTERYR